jgi:hypothetical protein
MSQNKNFIFSKTEDGCGLKISWLREGLKISWLREENLDQSVYGNKLPTYVVPQSVSIGITQVEDLYNFLWSNIASMRFSSSIKKLDEAKSAARKEKEDKIRKIEQELLALKKEVGV